MIATAGNDGALIIFYKIRANTLMVGVLEPDGLASEER
jgi:hypothetical protein